MRDLNRVAIRKCNALCAPAAGDMVMGPQVLAQVADVYRKLRFTLRFLLGNLHDFEPASDAIAYDALPATDRYVLSSFANLLKGLAASYETYQFFRVYQVYPPVPVTQHG